jgi:hypothetical protein
MARLDSRDKYPSGMEDYLAFNGWHFNKKMCDWAVSKMYKVNVAKRKEYISPYTKETVENLLKANNIKLDNEVGYDAVYVANMAKADFYGSSISDDAHLAKFIKDYLDDPDGYDGIVFTRFYADCIGSGTPIM